MHVCLRVALCLLFVLCVCARVGVLVLYMFVHSIFRVLDSFYDISLVCLEFWICISAACVRTRLPLVLFVQVDFDDCSGSQPTAQRLQYPLIKAYSLDHFRDPTTI